jgi:uncharacterized protein
MDRYTGKAINDLDHLHQSVEDILTTRLGTRVMRRDYGSRLPDYIDYPMNRDTVALIYAAVVEALDIWEPRLLIDRVIVNSRTKADIEEGKFDFTIEAFYIPSGETIRLNNIVVTNKEILNV